MADAHTPIKILRSTSGKENFPLITRLLISGGTSLLREIFDSMSSKRSSYNSYNPVKKKQLKATYLSIRQRYCPNPSPRVYDKSDDFDITLLFRLLRSKICNLTPPSTGWDAPPVTTDHSLTADMARNKVLPKLSL